MKNLQDATERICDLKGSLVALDALMAALLHELPASQRAGLLKSLDAHAEVARTVMLHTAISEHTLQAFERDVGRMASLISAPPPLADEGHVG
jgi:anti-sigma factor RsiW